MPSWLIASGFFLLFSYIFRTSCFRASPEFVRLLAGHVQEDKKAVVSAVLVGTVLRHLPRRKMCREFSSPTVAPAAGTAALCVRKIAEFCRDGGGEDDESGANSDSNNSNKRTSATMGAVPSLGDLCNCSLLLGGLSRQPYNQSQKVSPLVPVLTSPLRSLVSRRKRRYKGRSLPQPLILYISVEFKAAIAC